MTSIAVLKPDFGSNGGFERHLQDLMDRLAARGWEFELIELPVERRSRVFGIELDDPIRHRHDEFFLWAALAESVQRLDLGRFDLVLTTQPPTYLVDHPRVVALFYHHARQFYDQAELFADSGFVDPTIHRAAVAAVRSVEAEAGARITHFLAGSAEVAQRLRDFWQVGDDRISLYAAPPTSTPGQVPPYTPTGPALTVGRFEWPKRTELAIAAAHLGAGWPLELVGDGSRLEFARGLDRTLAESGAKAAETMRDEELWRNSGAAVEWVETAFASPVRFLGQCTDTERDAAYARSSVVITPTHREDYGLTVLEAMARARPVIVCRDGGGLTEFVDHGVNGLIVEPTARAIADAVDRLRADPDSAQAMGQAGLATVQSVTWDRAIETVEAAFHRSLR